MNETNRSKWRLRVAVLVVFVLGFTAGALALNVYTRFDRGRAEGRRQRFDQMLDRLQLTSDQKSQVHQILGDTREQLQALRKETEPRYEEIRRQADEKLRNACTNSWASSGSRPGDHRWAR